MALEFVGLAVHDVNAAAISFPSGNAGGIVLVRVSDALVILFAVLVFVRVRVGIAPAPELFDKVFALIVGLEFLERLALFVSDDVRDVFVKPVFVGLLYFGLNFSRFLRRVLAVGFVFLSGHRQGGER